MGGREVADSGGITKREGELAYWRGRQDAEGELANSWYERFYTDHFRLTHDDYVGKSSWWSTSRSASPAPTRASAPGSPSTTRIRRTATAW